MSDYLNSAHPVVSAKHNTLDFVEHNDPTAGGDLKSPDKQDLTNLLTNRPIPVKFM